MSDNKNAIEIKEHDNTYHVKKVSNFILDAAGNLTRDRVCGVTTQTLIDEASGTVTYIGRANHGVATSAAGWQIMKIDATANPKSFKYADSGSFSQIWDNRASTVVYA
ncbi:MAG TPA: hypothetical protein DCY12_06025 [Candidatus Atribacteria bacterium]|nr:hypothetical protein [Candidatus Atribacteria bacterium]